MKSYLTHLYEMELHENEGNPTTVPSYKEEKLYDELAEELPQEQFQKVSEFLELYETRLDDECEIYYKKGFQFAIRLILECFNEKF